MRLGSVVFLVSLCLGLGAFQAGIFKAVWENEAGEIDPWGGPKADDAGQIDPWGSPNTDDAGHIDPLGSTVDDGCQIDPWGRCASNATDDAGHIDPWGGSGQ